LYKTFLTSANVLTDQELSMSGVNLSAWPLLSSWPRVASTHSSQLMLAMSYYVIMLTCMSPACLVG